MVVVDSGKGFPFNCRRRLINSFWLIQPSAWFERARTRLAQFVSLGKDGVTLVTASATHHLQPLIWFTPAFWNTMTKYAI